MPAYILLAFDGDSIDLVVAHGEGPETLRVESSHRFALGEPTDAGDTQDPKASDDVRIITSEPAISDKSENSASEKIKAILTSLGDDYEILPVVVRSRSMSFHKLTLPFKEPNRLSQVVPLQIQDAVPFDVDALLCASTSMRQQSDGEYEILATLIPQTEIAQIIAFAQSVGIEPKVITTTSVALSYLPKVVYSYFQDSSEQGASSKNKMVSQNAEDPETQPNSSATRVLDQGICAVVGQSNSIFAMAALLDGEPFDFREFESTGLDNEELATEILCFVESLTPQSTSAQTVLLSALPANHKVNHILMQRGCNLRSVLVSEFFKPSSDISQDDLAHHPSDLAWAVSLLLTESRGLSKDFSELVNLRTGPFAYHPAFENVVSALKEEAFWFIMAAVCLAFWVGVQIYAQKSQLSVVESAMESNIATVFGAEKAPFNGELAFVEDRLSQLEDQLRGLGSISSLSPLESLRELSETIGPGIDIEVDSLNIGYSKIAFRGSVPDFPSVGQLSSALEKNSARFCKPKVDSAGREPGTTRVKYSAEIELCE